MPHAKIGVIGGSGLYNIEGMTGVQEVSLDTPFGKPSDAITVGMLSGKSIAFLPRHGKGHTILPTEIPVRANIYALKSLGVEHLIAVNAVGSFKQELKPGDLVIPDQIIDRTQLRVNTFFGDGVVGHIQFADPFCANLSRIIHEAALKTKATVHMGGTCIAMEGPAFSTRAESRLYKSWGASIIGMTALPEAKLAREAEMCYAMIAGVTDYDSWQDTAEPLEIATLIRILNQNVDTIKHIIKEAVTHIPKERKCPCASAMETAIVTRAHLLPLAQRKKLDMLIGKYMKDRR